MKKAERFEVLETIQEGALATSYKARDRELDRLVLLKVLLPRMAVDAGLVQRFRREAKLQARLKHQNIVTVYDFGSEEDFYIASEFIEGETLENVIRRKGRLTVAELAPVIRQVVAALEFAHGHGVVHRDLKPANIMISSRGEAKLTDFGLAYARDYDQLTQEGFVLGTPAYMSPEQARGRQTDARTDLFSLAIVIYQALSGSNPFQSDSHADAMSMILNRDAPPLDKSVPGITPGLALLVPRMLERDRDKRDVKLSEVTAAFALSNGETGARPGRRSAFVPVSISVAGAAVVAIALFLVFGRGDGRGVSPVPPAGDSVAGYVPDTLRRPDRRTESPDTIAEVVRDESVARVPPVTEPVPVEPKALSRLRLTVMPWAEVYIDGKPVGVTPLTGDIELEAGRHEIAFSNPYFPRLTRSVTLGEGPASMAFDLNDEFAMVDIRVTPWAVLVVDGEVVDTTPIGHPIPMIPGAHTIELLHPDLGARTETVTLDSAGPYRLSFNLDSE